MNLKQLSERNKDFCLVNLHHIKQRKAKDTLQNRNRRNQQNQQNQPLALGWGEFSTMANLAELVPR